MKENKNTVFKQSILDIFFVWSKEFHTIIKDQGVMIFFILVPIAYPLIYAFIYTNETVHEVPVVVVDESHSSRSREFIRKVDATADIHILSYAADIEEAKNIMKHKKAYGCIYIPSDFDQLIEKGEQVDISIFCDMSGLLYYKALLSACTDVSLEMNKDIQVSRMTNVTERQEQINTHPIEYTYVTLFNPQNGFGSFLIPAVLMLIIQQTLLLGIGLSAGTAREKNSYRELAPINQHYRGTFRIVIGKSLVYLMIYAVMAAYIACIVPRLFNMVQISDIKTLFGFMFPYLTACIFFAMTASIFIRNRETCILIFVFTSVPLLFISGISWPGTSIPAFWKVFSWIFPSTFGINGFVHINNMGATLDEVVPEYRALWIQTGIYFITTCIVYRYQIWKSQKTK